MANADLKKFLPKRMAQVIGNNLPAIINAFNGGAGEVEQTIQACIDQLFISTASGRYLLSLGEEGGFTVPADSSLDVRAFRVLVPIMVSNPKQVRLSINDLIQAFYGSERTKASVSTTVFGPYNADDGDDLFIETDAGSFSVNILANQVFDINAVSATELASVINYSQNLVLADVVVDRTTQQETLRLSSKTAGTGSFIRITGGKLQNVLKFDKLVPTNIVDGLAFDITKTSLLDDVVKIAWNGVGTNPEMYNIKPGDVFTIRGLVDVGLDEFSNLNGSYTVLDSGYDYVKIRNVGYSDLVATLTLVDSDSFVFTKSDKLTLFDQSEYAFSSEIEDQTITVTVPAVPPLTIRFLGGSAHAQGSSLAIVDFSRTSAQFDLPDGVDAPVADNQFLIYNTYQRPDFSATRFETYLSDGDPNVPIYQVSPADADHTVFPYTTSTNIGTNCIYATVDDSVIRIKFNFPHGLYKGWGFNLIPSSGGSNFLLADLNKEHVVREVVSATEVLVTVKNTNGTPKLFNGFAFGPADVYRHTLSQADGSDFYIDFPDSPSLLAAGFSVGDVFKFDPLAGIDIDPFYASALKYKRLAVTSIVNTGLIHRINFVGGFGPGVTGLVIQNSEGLRSGLLGGSTNYYLNKLSTHNQDAVFNGLKAVFLNVTQSSNPGYVGSFVFDPQGEQTGVTVSQYVADLSDNLLKGEAVATLMVDSLSTNGQFPSSGKLVIGYGTNRYEGPINYFSTIESPGSNQIVVDPAYKYKFSHPVGDKVQFIHETQPYTPTKFGKDFPVYVTGTTQAREAMFTLIKSLVAAGIFIEKEVILPDLRYDDVMIPIFE